MKNSPYLDKPLRSEREAQMEAWLQQMVDDWPQDGEDGDDGYMNGRDVVDALVGYIYEAKELIDKYESAP